jgi:hypothetical protein
MGSKIKIPLFEAETTSRTVCFLWTMAYSIVLVFEKSVRIDFCP